MTALLVMTVLLVGCFYFIFDQYKGATGHIEVEENEMLSEGIGVNNAKLKILWVLKLPSLMYGFPAP